MAEPTQFTFDLNELTTALVRHQDIHEGFWMLAFEFSLGAGLFGPSSAEAKPTAFVQVNNVQLIRQPELPVDSRLAVDAAKVNPAPRSESGSSRSKKSVSSTDTK